MGTYHLWKSGEDIRGGMMDITGRVPDEVPSHWMVYFTVPDADAAAETAKANGGQVTFGPADIPGTGRFAIVQDPQGAVFSVMAPTEETRGKRRRERRGGGFGLERRRFARVADLALVLPFGRLAE